MTKIFAVALNLHDHNTYNGVWHNQRERFTRFKHNLPYKVDSYAHQEQLDTADFKLNNDFVKDYFRKQESAMLAFSMTIGGIRMCKDILPGTVLDFKPKKLFKNQIGFLGIL